MRILSPDPLEVYSGVLSGPRRTPLHSHPASAAGSPKAVFRDVVVEALAATPCHVAFSGGRDSSAVLAFAVQVARQEGLDEPIPLTARYPGHTASEESEWQEVVIRHLDIQDWLVYTVDDELDLLGDLAVGILREHGPYFPAMAHNIALMAKRAGGGTLMTGSGGDEFLTRWPLRRYPFEAVWKLRPRARAAFWTGVNLLPTAARAAILSTRLPWDPIPWLREEPQAVLAGEWRRSLRREHQWNQALAQVPFSRFYELLRAACDGLAAREGVQLVEPLYDLRLLNALSRQAPRQGFASRAEGISYLVGDLLPDRVLRRSSKASFNTVFMGPRARQFASEWNADSGVDHDLVDARQLRAEWLTAEPDARSFAALQYVWLRSQP